MLSPLQQILKSGRPIRMFVEFAGFGGSSLAAQLAGMEVRAAANHWPLAVKLHELNHPGTRHICQDLRQFDFSTLWDEARADEQEKGEDPMPFDGLWASPSCQGHSSAGQVGRRKSPRVAKTHNQLRATAWAVVDCLEVCRPAFAVVENVVEMERWELVESWKGAIRQLGYTLTAQPLTASRWGVGQRRTRMIYVAHLRGPEISLEDPTCAETSLAGVFDRSAQGWVDIDEMRSRTAKAGHLSAQEKARESNKRARGGLAWGQHTNYGRWGKSTREPAPTITTVPGHLFWTKGGRYRLWTDRELARATSFPDSYALDLPGKRTTRKDAARLIGNAVPPEMGRGILEAVKAEALRAA